MDNFQPYTESILKLLLPIIDEKHQIYGELSENFRDFCQSLVFSTETITSVYISAVAGKKELERCQSDGLHLELLQEYSKQIVALRFLKFVSTLTITETENLFSLVKQKTLDASKVLNKAQTLLTKTLGQINTYQGLEWLIFAYNFLREALESYSSAVFVDGSFLNTLFAAMVSIHQAETFISFLDSVLERNRTGRKTSLKAFDAVAKEIVQSAQEIFASVGEEHINNLEEEQLYTLLKEKRLYDLETALKNQDNLLAINLSHQIIFDSSFIIHWGINLPQSYVRRQVESKITQFTEGIQEIRKRGRWDGILPLYYFEKSLVSGSPPQIISAVNTSGLIMSILERDIKKPTLSYFY